MTSIDNSLLASASVLLVAAITPGPNNLVVFRTAARGGFAFALPAISAIVIGGVLMLALVSAGINDAFERWPALRTAIAVGGAAYLAFLGCQLMRTRSVEPVDPALPAGVPGLIGFQFLNPKSWVMVLSLVAACPASHALTRFAYLPIMFVMIPGACLLVWALAGDRLASRLANPATRRWVDRILGASLIASALALLL
ncbi:MAG: LysE family translocator [Dokdonella sp.]|uniref:LysE family translocator n=1 Tax=Dokdonella sp. TaxID=2291710 RepID=UPI0032649D66